MRGVLCGHNYVIVIDALNVDEARAAALYRQGGSGKTAQTFPRFTYDPRLAAPPRDAQSLELLEKSARADDPVALFQLGWLLATNPEADFATLAVDLGAAIGAEVTLRANSTHAVLELAGDKADQARQTVRELRPGLRVMSDGAAIEISKEAKEYFPEDLLHRHLILPIEINNGGMMVAMSDPLNTSLIAL